jgi:hypothetical protein
MKRSYLQRASPETKTPLSLKFEWVRDLGERRERSIILPKVVGGGRRWCASLRWLGVEMDALAGGPVVVVARVTRDQNAPVAQVRAGPGPGGATRAFKHPSKSRRGWQEVVRVAEAARRQD